MAETDPDRSFAIEDYFLLSEFAEVSLSSDGSKLAYVVTSNQLDSELPKRRVIVSDCSVNARQTLVEELQNSRSIAWITGTERLAFLREIHGISQVFSYDVSNGLLHQHTDSTDPVVSFQFGNSPTTLAWVTTAKAEMPVHDSLSFKKSNTYESIYEGQSAFVVDQENLSLHDFVNPNWPSVTERPKRDLWVISDGNPASKTSVPGQVKQIHWSSDASKISVVFVSDELPMGALYDKYTSMGILDVVTGTFDTVFGAAPPVESMEAQYYRGGEWVPNSNKFYVRRTSDRDRWISETHWSLVDLNDLRKTAFYDLNWHETSQYHRDEEPAFIPKNEEVVFANKTVNARRRLYLIRPSGEALSGILEDVSGAVSHVKFSSDFKTAVFVSQSLNKPPEIYKWSEHSGVTRLTNLNEEFEQIAIPISREVIWESSDGVSVQGWLIEPPRRSSNHGPVPMVTFIHGGPATPVSDEFGYYFTAYGGLWPYPHYAYAANGIAVFMPNYRGTRTFGTAFEDPQGIDQEPVDDIVTGIEFLISEGVADPKHLGISGHSHGGWLAPYVMTRFRSFSAGSFAEGSLDMLSTYFTSPGWLNREVHDPMVGNGVSIYEFPDRYIKLSPIFDFEDLYTASLFEAGARSLALLTMSAPKAATRAGMPAEFVIYPRTGHNIKDSKLQIESAKKNLDWFRFWLQGYEDSEPAKEVQYRRWRAMRDSSCSLTRSVHPSYCESRFLQSTPENLE